MDPYKTGMFKTNPYAKKEPICGNLVVVLDGKFDGRGLKLIPQPSRCLLLNEVHELILTDEDAKPNNIVNEIAYIGFFVVKKSAIVVVNDHVEVEGKNLGVIAGFDETHMPNHYNIVVKSDKRNSGLEMGFELGDEVIIG